MGMSICKAVAPFKISNVAWGSNDDTDHEILGKILSTIEEVLEEDWDFKGTKLISGWDVEIHSMTYPKESTNHVVYPNRLTKGRYSVYLLNEHEYSNGGGVTLSIFSNDRESLEEICKDWSFDSSRIEANAPVIQVL